MMRDTEQTLSVADQVQADSELYKRLSTEMRQGLKQIYSQISLASTMDIDQAPAATDDLFHEASTQLSAVLSATEEATVHIMDVVEKHLDMQEESESIISALKAGSATPEQLTRLAEINLALGTDLTEIMTSLSFQDITGQRIKKVVSALTRIEATVLELYLSSGLIIKGREANPRKNIDELHSEAQEAVQKLKVPRPDLKGPQQGTSQASIDDLLSQLGLD
ncbi:MAG: protein phosphatase CheZ [Desulfovibrionaceae bacterium]